MGVRKRGMNWQVEFERLEREQREGSKTYRSINEENFYPYNNGLKISSP